MIFAAGKARFCEKWIFLKTFLILRYLELQL